MAVNVVSFSFSRAVSTGALESTLLGAGFLYCILSASSLDPNSSGPQAPSAWGAFPLPQLISTGTQLNSSNPTGFPYHISSHSSSNSTSSLLSWLSYIIVQRLLYRPLDLWNRMFNRHQAEITVMQVQRSISSSASVYESIMGFFFLPRPILSTISANTISSHNWH